VGPRHGDCRPEGSLRAQERSRAYGSAFLGQVPACRIGTVGDLAPSEPVAVVAPGDVVAADLPARPGGSGLVGSLSTDVMRLVGDGDDLRGAPVDFPGYPPWQPSQGLHRQRARTSDDNLDHSRHRGARPPAKPGVRLAKMGGPQHTHIVRTTGAMSRDSAPLGAGKRSGEPYAQLLRSVPRR